MLSQMEQKFRRGVSFAFETTLSGRNYVRHIRKWKQAGYHVKLIFLSLPSAEMAVARVKTRVSQGGHDVPEAVVRRRFDAGLRNFEGVYRDLVNSWVLYDNSGSIPRWLAAGENP
jgi:predicted ABC-type ATPase